MSVQGVNNRGLYEMGRPREIGEGDVRYAVELASRVHLPADRILLQMFPQDFGVDGRNEYRNPRGALGSRLESFVHVITASAQEHQCLVGAVHQAHLAVEETVFEPLAAAYASVLPEDRSEGVVVVDIGAHSTDLVVYYGDVLLHAVSLAVSGDHFTKDVSYGLCINYDDAQRLKEECGCAILGLTSDNSIIEVPSPEGRPPREAPRRELNRILEARAEELFLYVRRELSGVGMDQALANGIVLVGAGAILTGMCDMAERVINCQARNGLAIGINNWPEEIDTPAWTTAAGLMMYSARLKYEAGQRRRGPGVLGMLFG
jgi:cell division protein FtsA